MQEFEEEEVFPNMSETVIIKDTWDVVSKQVKSIGMEAFDKLWTLNSDMSAYLPQVSTDCTYHVHIKLVL